VRLALVAVTTALVALAVGSAGAAPERTALIRPGQGIGKLRLGMTPAEARRALGEPRVVVRRRAAFGFTAVEWEFGYAEYRVRFFGRAGRLRATRVGTTLVRERTPRRVGVGTRERTLRRVYRGLSCERLETRGAGPAFLPANVDRDCTLLSPSGRRTIFTTSPGSLGPYLRPVEWEARARVVEVAVAEAR
jgi:hypothetical protein